jgi:hypothetical protein
VIEQRAVAGIELEPSGMVKRERAANAGEGRDHTQMRTCAMFGDCRRFACDDAAFTSCGGQMRPRENLRFDRDASLGDLAPTQHPIAVGIQVQQLVQVAQVEVPGRTHRRIILRVQ